jgi:hypothetical protein
MNAPLNINQNNLLESYPMWYNIRLRL